jgi:hypothetical protein
LRFENLTKIDARKEGEPAKKLMGTTFRARVTIEQEEKESERKGEAAASVPE